VTSRAARLAHVLTTSATPPPAAPETVLREPARVNVPLSASDPLHDIPEAVLDEVVDGWVNTGKPLSEHAIAAIEDGFRRLEMGLGPRADGERVPGCTCYPCTGRRPRPARPRIPTEPRRALPVEEAKSTPILSVVALLGIEGLRRNGRTHRGPCPLHGGSGPNFSVDPDKGRFKCFVCGEGGTGVDLVMAMRKCDFRTAVDFIVGR
jgi:hypothetical protein